MSRPSTHLVRALRATAARLRLGADYAWTHMGACNCGHLAQTITGLSPAEVRAITYEKPSGEWAEQARDYCPTSGYRVDALLTVMFDLGLGPEDVVDLERLRNPAVLARMKTPPREVSYRDRAHVVEYMEAWADLLDEARRAARPALAVVAA